MDATPDRDDAPAVLLLRHAVAVLRGAWFGDQDQRPLDGRGRAQADALPAHLAANDLDPIHLVAGTAARCRATLAPLAEASGLQIALDDRFSERSPPLRSDDGWGDAAWLGGRALAGLDDAVRVAMSRDGGRRRAHATASESPPLPVVVVCSHGEVLPALLAALGGRGRRDLTRGPDLTRKAMVKGAGWLMIADRDVVLIDPPAIPDARGRSLPQP